MKQQQFLDLIAASQYTIKNELLSQHPESKYQLLMLSRSFDLLQHYILHQQTSEQKIAESLEQHFHMPIQNLDEGIAYLCENLRKHIEPHHLETLEQLNHADLMLSHPKVIKYD